MKSGSENRRWLQQARKSWLVLMQGVLWVGGVLGGFLLPPPVGVSADDEKTWLRLGQFIVAVVLGLEILAARIIGGPGQRELLIAEERGDADDQRQQRHGTPTE